MNRRNIYEVTNLFDLKTLMQNNLTVILGFTTPYNTDKEKAVVRKFLKRKSEIFPLITFVYMEVSDKDRQTLNILKFDKEEFPKVYHIRDGKDILVDVPHADLNSLVESFSEVEKYYIAEMKEYQKKMHDVTIGTSIANKQNISNKKKQVEFSDDDERIDIDNMNDSHLIDDESSDLQQIGRKVPDLRQIINPSGDMPTEDDEIEQQMEAPVEQKLDPILEKKKNLEKLVMLNKKADDMKLNLVKEIARRKKIEAEEQKNIVPENKEEDGKEYRKKKMR